MQGFRVSDQGEASGLPLHRRSEHLLGDSVQKEVEVGIQTHIRAASRGQCPPEAGGIHSEPQHGLLGLETPGLVEKEAGWRGGIRRGDIDCLPCLLRRPHRSCFVAPNMSFGVQAQQLAVDFAVVRPLGISLTAQPVLGDLLKLSHALAEHLEGGDQSSVSGCEDLRRGLDRSSGHGGGGECEQVDKRRGGAMMRGAAGTVLRGLRR